MNGMLKVIFIILLLILLGELGYFFYTSQQPKLKTGESIKSDFIGENIPSKQAVTLTNTPTLIPSFINIREQMVKSGEMKTNLNTTEIQSTIFNIDNIEGTFDDVQYKIKLTLKVGKDKYIDYYLSEYDLGKTRMQEITNDKTSEIDISDLKIGDTVNIVSRTDYTKPKQFRIVEYIITRINDF